MGGLWKKMPVTFVTFLVATLAIAGVPFLSGFFSKDAILLLAWRSNPGVFYILAFTSLLTAIYMGRIIFVAFLGKPRSHHVEEAHESRPDMLVALVVLAFGAVLAGYTGLYPHVLGSYLHDNVVHATESEHLFMLGLSAVLSIGGLLIAWAVYYRPLRSDDTFQRNAPSLFALVRSKLCFDEIYLYYVKRVQQRVASIIAFLEQVLIQGVCVRGFKRI